MKKIIHQDGLEIKPPSSNTEAQNTEVGVRALIDYCAFTLSFDDVKQAYSLLGIPESDFIPMPAGAMKYKSQVRCGEISIFYDGNTGMGVHVQMKGQGCREYESRFGNAWVDLFKRVLPIGHFARLDGAIDDFDKHFTLEQIKEKIDRRELTTRFNSATSFIDYDLSAEPFSNNGETVRFGDPKSRLFVRMYDKAKQQKVDYSWIRTEIQCRNERANILAMQIVGGVELGQILCGVLKNYINFLDTSSDTNKSRWPVSDFWQKFLGEVDKVKLTVARAVKTIFDTMNWISHQAAPSIALILKYFKGDYSFFDKLILQGEKRLKPKHYALLQAG